MPKTEIPMVLEKQCKGSNRFATAGKIGADGKPFPITNAYVNKEFCGDAKGIVVTVELS